MLLAGVVTRPDSGKAVAMRPSFQTGGYQSSGFRPDYRPPLDRGTASTLLDVLRGGHAAPSPSQRMEALGELRRRLRSDRADFALDVARGALRC
jgi:hypothetical protein